METAIIETCSYMSVISEKTTTTAHNISLGISHDYDTPVFPWVKAMLRMLIIFSGIILFSGLFGNVMILLLLGRLRSSESCLDVFFIALAFSDLCLLLTAVLRVFVKAHFLIDIYDTHNVVCKMCTWILSVTGVVSAWSLVVMSVQRAMSLIWPHRVKVLCTRKKSKLMLSALVIVVMLVHAHILHTHEIRETNLGKKSCALRLDYNQFAEAWQWADLLMTSFLPFLFLAASNSVLIWKLTSAVKSARMTLSSAQSDQSAARNSRASSVTLTLICLSLTFLLLTMPYSLVLLFQKPLKNMIKDVNDLTRFDFFYGLTCFGALTAPSTSTCTVSLDHDSGMSLKALCAVNLLTRKDT